LAVRIRLTRVGATKRPSYRVVAIDSRRPRDGRSLEILGFYDPLTEPATVHIDADKLNAWIAKGARPSDAVGKLMRQAAMASAPAAPVAAPAKSKAAPKTTRAKKTPAKAAAPAKAEPTEAEPAETAAAAPADTAAAETTAEQPIEVTAEDATDAAPEAKADA
jgi:small subunit ribosomal protein S16